MHEHLARRDVERARGQAADELPPAECLLERHLRLKRRSEEPPSPRRQRRLDTAQPVAVDWEEIDRRIASALGDERQAVIPVIGEQLDDICNELRALQADNLQLRGLIAAAERREAALNVALAKAEIWLAELRQQLAADRGKALDLPLRSRVN